MEANPAENVASLLEGKAMAKLDYGFDGKFSHLDHDGWTNLKTINEFLEDGEPIPADLAQWLGHAIRYSSGDPKELLRRLGLVKPRGRQAQKHDASAWLEWGGRVWRLEETLGREAALAEVLAEYAAMHGEEVSRSHLQNWRDTYAEARAGK